MMTGDDISDAAEIRWKLGPTHPKATCLLMRLATKSKYQNLIQVKNFQHRLFLNFICLLTLTYMIKKIILGLGDKRIENQPWLT